MCERSESAREQRIALYKSDEQSTIIHDAITNVHLILGASVSVCFSF